MPGRHQRPPGGKKALGHRVIDGTGWIARGLRELRRDRIGFVFQSYNLNPVLTACENAEFVLALQNVPKALRRQRVMAVLAA